MVPYSDVSLVDFQKALTTPNLRGIQIIYAGLGVGVVSIAAVAVFLSMFLSTIDIPPDPTVVRWLSYIHLVVALAVYSLSSRIFDFAMGSRRFTDRWIAGHSRKKIQPGPAEMLFQSMKGASIIRLAFLEGVALFGITICIIASFHGVLPTYPVYWLNALSSLVFVAHVIGNFPTKARLEDLFRERRTGATAR